MAVRAAIGTAHTLAAMLFKSLQLVRVYYLQLGTEILHD
jgi:hypothetical protein